MDLRVRRQNYTLGHTSKCFLCMETQMPFSGMSLRKGVTVRTTGPLKKDTGQHRVHCVCGMWVWSQRSRLGVCLVFEAGSLTVWSLLTATMDGSPSGPGNPSVSTFWMLEYSLVTLHPMLGAQPEARS